MRIIDISRPLEESTAVFPGDVSFSRSITMSMADGASCNVSAFHGSAHAGTHVDLPFHFSDDKSVPDLSAFCGSARVVALDDGSALPEIPSGIRVLLKTRNSAAPTTVFDSDFMCISSDVVDWLARNEAVLVGVDGPSVDPVTSKDLPNHHALLNANVAILENLDLSNAEPGDYELIALPLKIPAADATWVRAILRQ